MEEDDRDKQEWFEEMLLEGVIEFSGVDEVTGEMLYNFSSNLEESHPKIFERMLDMVQKEIYSLWEKGFVSMDVTKENPMVFVNEKALDEEAVKTELNRDEQRSLELIIFYIGG